MFFVSMVAYTQDKRTYVSTVKPLPKRTVLLGSSALETCLFLQLHC